MSCDYQGHVGAEDARNQPKYRCIYCGAWGYYDRWTDGCCPEPGENLTPEGEKIYPEECDCDCHMSEQDKQDQLPESEREVLDL